eukprot:scaffold16128_cov48-Phaeocystis_antarctica.AAC.2
MGPPSGGGSSRGPAVAPAASSHPSVGTYDHEASFDLVSRRAPSVALRSRPPSMLSAVPTPTCAAGGPAVGPPPGRPQQQQQQPEAPRRAPFGSGSARWGAAPPADERAALERQPGLGLQQEPTRRRAPAFSFQPVSVSAAAGGRQ